VVEVPVAGVQLVDLREEQLAMWSQLAPTLREPGGQVVLEAPDAAIGGHHPLTTDLLDEVPEELASFDAVEERSETAQLERASRDAGEIVGHPTDLTHQRPNVLAAFGHLDVEQLLDGHGVAEVVDQRRDVVEAVGVREDLQPGRVLAHLLEATVQVA